MSANGSWPRCGSADLSIEQLRRGLERATNPQGVLRGRSVRQPPLARNATARPPNAAAAAGASSQSTVSITGTPVVLEAQPALTTQRAAAPRPLILPHEPHAKRLDGKRARLIIKSRKQPPSSEDWACAICLSADWQTKELSTLPRCRHTFHTQCIERWHQKSNDCPFCRVLV